MAIHNDNTFYTDKVQQLLEKSIFYYNLSKFNDAQSSCFQAIQICSNDLLKGRLCSIETQLIELVMNSFSKIKGLPSSDNVNISIDEKLKWLSSKINNEFFPPLLLTKNKIPITFINSKDKAFDDDFNYSIFMKSSTNLQNKKKIEWIHTSELSDCNWELTDPGLLQLYQDNNMSTCSLSASMISIINCNPKILSNIIHPFGINSYKYSVCLFVNGCQRTIRINDKLPFLIDSCSDDNMKSLSIKSYSTDLILWPGLIEKAYLKLVGNNSYEFDGSNSGFDTYLLIGWIPQYLKSNHIINKDDFWNLIYDNFRNQNVGTCQKNVLINAGTGNSDITTIVDGSNSILLAANHDFSVIDLKISTTEKYLLIRNPWYIKTNRDCWIKLDKFLKCFETIYLNWNPEFFKTKVFKKFVSLVKHDSSSNSDIMDKPQYTIQNNTFFDQKVLLFINEDIKNFKDKKQNSKMNNTNNISIITKVTVILSEKGQRFLSYSSGDKILTSIETRNILFSKFFVIPAKMAITVIIETKSGVKKNNNLNYTNDKLKADNIVVYNINCYSFMEHSISLKKSIFEDGKVEKIIDKWDSKNSGGNWLYSDYVNNPQYVLELIDDDNDKCEEYINIHLFVKDLEVLFNLQIFWYPGKYGIQSFDSKKLIYNEKYKGDGELILENLKLQKNRKYILLLSTYLPLSELNLDVCEYKLIIQSRCEKLQLQKLNNIDKKLFNKKLEFNWNNSNRKELYLKLSRSSTINIRAFSSDDYDPSEKTIHHGNFNNNNFKRSLDSYRPKIRINIFHQQSIVYKQEMFDDNLYGLFINDLQLDGGTDYLLILERFESGSGDIILQIGCNMNFELLSTN